MNECALSNEQIQEITETYLNGNDKNVKSLLDELSLVIYNIAYKNNENFLQIFIEYREEEIGYLDRLENLLMNLKEKENNFR